MAKWEVGESDDAGRALGFQAAVPLLWPLVCLHPATIYDDTPRRIDTMTFWKTPPSRRLAVSALAALATLGIVGFCALGEAATEGRTFLQQTITGPYTVRLGQQGSTYSYHLAPGTLLTSGDIQRVRISGGSPDAPLSGTVERPARGKQGGDARSSSTHKLVAARLVIPLEVEGATPKDRMLLAGIEGGVTAVDDQGTVLRSQENALPAPNLVPFPTQFGSSGGQERVYLSLPDSRATQLKSLEGNLLVMRGKVRQFSFPLEQLRVGAEQSSGQVTVRLTDVQRSGGLLRSEPDLEVGLDCSVPVLPPATAAEANDPQAMRQQRSRLFRPRGATVELVDAEGRAYPAGSFGIKSGGGSTSFVNAPTGLAGSVATESSAAAATSRTTASIRAGFTLPAGVKPTTLRVSVVEHQGPDQRIPFKLTDIPLRRLQ